MLPFEFLDIVDGLTQVDPVRSYPLRAGALIAQLCGAESFVFVPDAEGGAGGAGSWDAEAETGAGAAADRTRVVFPLRAGRRSLGQLVLVLAEGKARLEPHDLRTARWAVRVMGRCLDYATRMRHEPPASGLAGVSQTLERTPLTPRERDVVALLLGGASTRQIASDAHLTVGTVHTYLKRIYPKLGVRSRLELVVRLVGTHSDVASSVPSPRRPSIPTPQPPPLLA